PPAAGEHGCHRPGSPAPAPGRRHSCPSRPDTPSHAGVCRHEPPQPGLLLRAAGPVSHGGGPAAPARQLLAPAISARLSPGPREGATDRAVMELLSTGKINVRAATTARWLRLSRGAADPVRNKPAPRQPA